MKILICDDHTLFRQGLRLVLADLDPNAEILEAEEGEEALRLIANDEEIDLLLLDLHMPGMDGWISLRQIRSRYPTIPVVIVSASENPADVRLAMDGGASGFIPKSSSSAQLLAAVREVLEGGIYTPTGIPAAEPAEAGAPPAPAAGRLAGLSEREREVLGLMSQGLTSREIADQLGIAEATVSMQIAGILQALDLGGNATSAE